VKYLRKKKETRESKGNAAREALKAFKEWQESVGL
jgi:hypothetical protein